MREIIVFTLLLGVISVQALSQTRSYGDFMFQDVDNRCWRCDSSFNCRPCSFVFNPDTWPITCPAPTAADCTDATTRFPHTSARLYWQCTAANVAPTAVACDCDLVFDYVTGTCVFPFAANYFCDSLDLLPEPCAETTTTTLPVDTTTLPDDTTLPGDTTTTTLGTTTTVSDTTTTPSPCVCVVWWPCPCNPCWQMPCQSCGGCPGGMGGGMMGGMGGMGGMGMMGMRG